MNILKIFYPKESIKRKILEIKEDMSKLVRPLCGEKFWIDWYGAYDIDPKNLVFWVCVRSDEMKSALRSNTDLNQRLRELLSKYEYPEKARQQVHIGFESQETVDRESNGNWYQHFK